VRFLVDESLASRVATLLAEAGHDAIHVSDRELAGAADPTVLAAAQHEDRVVITADTDFGTLLALSSSPQPSVILLRRPGRRAEQRVGAVLEALEMVGAALDEGALVVVEPARVRVRMLPFAQGSG
jgi:predicted nuclease of predicted toxin-antitoxin system